MANLIQVPSEFIDSKLSRLDIDLYGVDILFKQFKETRELGLLFDLIEIKENFYAKYSYLSSFSLDSRQKRKLSNLMEKIDPIFYYIVPEIDKLKRCKV
ncbi:MAG: hypothetical protein Q8M94_11620 [Ignavibacteria bacterium]|nr:hypothetical protein [Ignavibacteria bacterium]